MAQEGPREEDIEMPHAGNPDQDDHDEELPGLDDENNAAEEQQPLMTNSASMTMLHTPLLGSVP